MMEIPVKIPKTPLCSAAAETVAALRNAGFPAYFVGGAPRDILLGKTPHDIDIATSAAPDDIAKIFPKTIPVGAAFCIMTVVSGPFQFEVATFREERGYTDGRHPGEVFKTSDPRRDVLRRDFTVNAFLLDPETGILTDHTGGLADMRRGLLRTIGDPAIRFGEDYLRMLRAVRFAVRMDYELDESAQTVIRENAASVAKISMERIRDELEKMLLGPHPDRAIRMLSDLNLLRVVLPEVEAMHGVTQPPEFHPEGDVFEHTMLMLARMAVPSRILAWSILLHDVGKRAARTEGPDGIPHFYGHEAVGADMIPGILSRLRLPNTVTAAVESAVRNHMRFAHIDKMKDAKWKRIAAEPGFALELELHRIDCSCSNGLLGNYILMLDRLHDLADQPATPKSFLGGRDLLAAGLIPGPDFKKILDDAFDLQLEGTLKSRTDALVWLHRVLKKHTES